ncbi:DUF6174 domain-containing protein [Nocardioides humi]|uniref:Lipoprotein n=1 Tax=Nocardioides humi TaxID=449461 RepID=A0ABN1ZP26_9ACTN|nr:DUF6174 domain-containing protein [Nocardioides humi]
MRLPAAALTAALTSALLLTATACTKESDRAADRTTASASPSGTPTGSGTPSAGSASYPAFAPQDYTYELEVLCFCPQTGPVEVTVRDGEVANAVALDDTVPGGAVPEFAQLTIQDVIEMANDPDVDKASVEWPAGQDHPDSVMLDRIAQAVDDEVTYTIKNVRISAG